MRKTLLLRKDMRFCVAECTNKLCNLTGNYVYDRRGVNIQQFMHVSACFMHKKEGLQALLYSLSFLIFASMLLAWTYNRVARSIN